MRFRSLLQSSRFEIVASKNAVALIYFALSSAIITFWVVMCMQFFTAYYELGEFDAPVWAFILITLILFFPMLLVGCFMLSALIQRERLIHWIKTRVIVTNYQASLSPAEAGTIYDYEYSNNEAWATLLNLHFRKEIILSAGHASIYATRNQPINQTYYEKAFLDALFGFKNSEATIQQINDQLLIDAGLSAHILLAGQLEAGGALQARVINSNAVRKLARSIYILAGLGGFYLVLGFVFGGESFWNINYPRYEVSTIQSLFMYALTIIGVIIAATGFWPRFEQDIKSKPATLALESAGFYEYLKRVYSVRFNSENIHAQAPSEVMALAPYMIAYKLVPLDMNYIQTVLTTAEKSTS
ncbi:MAG: DUF2207 domain-containing protein [bacterium]|nr:DUF2207 domain-containing protein [bacterium]